MSALLKEITSASKLNILIKKNEKMKNLNTTTDSKGCITQCGLKKHTLPVLRVDLQFKGSDSRSKNSKISKVFRLYTILYYLEYNQGGEISHKCHNKGCINIKHLIIVPHIINCSRRKCREQRFCSEHKQKCI